MPRVLKMTRDAVRRRHLYRMNHAKSAYDARNITCAECFSQFDASGEIYLREINQVLESELEIKIALIHYRANIA